MAIPMSPTLNDTAEFGERCTLAERAGCSDIITYTITDQHDWKSPFKQLPYSCTSHGDGAECQLAASYGVETGVAVEVGFNLGLDIQEIFNVGIDVAVTVESSKSFETGVTQTCPGSLTCGFFQQDSIHLVSGQQITTTNCVGSGCGGAGGSHSSQEQPYQISFPKVDGDGRPISTFDICLCPGQSQDLPEAGGLYVCQNEC
jgi:hypothetical protein